MIADREQPPPVPAEASGGRFADAMRELRNRPRETWLDLARHDQSDRWRSGVGVEAEQYFALLPELHADVEEAMVLICGEAQLREELGTKPALSEYQRRFPELSDELALQFDVDKLFHRATDVAEFSEVETIDASADGSQHELGGYELLAEIGRGASGVVYRARQKSLNRLVAIKILENPGDDPARAHRQQQEAEILARLTHPNVVRVYEVLSHRGRVHLVMELVEGPTLRESTSGRPMNARLAAELMATLADTVHAVHESGILHRDLKPSNVLLASGNEPKVTDFGLAKLQVEDNYLTTNDSILGTPSYMSPEQAIGDVAHIGPTSDVYSLGAIIYELLTGRPPFLGVTILDTLALIREREPVSPRQLQPKTPRDLETICLECLQKRPLDRYPNARELANDLRRFLHGELILARPPGPTERIARYVRRKPAVVTALALLAALLVVTSFFAYRMRQQQLQLSAAALVEAVATADAQTLPRLLERIAADAEHTRPLIQTALAEGKPFGSAWLNLSLAELAIDPAAPTGQVLVYLPQAHPSEVAPIVNLLAEHRMEISETVWEQLLNEKSPDDERLRVACLAARLAPTDERWTAVANPVARALVHQHPLDVAAFTTALLPVRNAITPAIVALFRNGQLESANRRAALSIVARYATEEVETLVDLAVSAQPDEFALLIPALEQQADRARPLLQEIFGADVNIRALQSRQGLKSTHDVERVFDNAQSRRATAAAALWRLGDESAALSVLSRGGDADVRAWLVELLVPMGISISEVLAQINDTSDAGTRQAFVMALGQSPANQLQDHTRQMLIGSVSRLYTDDADAGVHAACRWLLAARLHADDTLAELDEQVARVASPGRSWQSGPNHHYFSIVHIPSDFKTGSPPDELWREADEIPRPNPRARTIAMSMYEVTVEQYQRFRPWTGDSLYTPQPECPINNVSWFDAASYCRWLSEQEHVPEDQMVYPPADEIKPGMRLAADWQDRTGYRLPNEVEWEYACRAGTTASRYCGDGTAMLRHYAWYLNFSDDHSWPVGQLKPNELGLFDMLGNVAERCHQQGALPASAEVAGVDPSPAESPLVILENQGTARGAEFADVAQNIRAARVYGVPASAEWGTVGFRVVRTIAAE
ncbi:MAG: protein kinase [Pirellulales bacterium]